MKYIGSKIAHILSRSKESPNDTEKISYCNNRNYFQTAKQYLISCLLTAVIVTSFTPWLHAEKDEPGISEAKTMKCPSCNTLYSAETKYCGNDGSKLVEISKIMVCPVCKKAGAPEEKFCREHGKELVPSTIEEAETQRAEIEQEKKARAQKYYQEGNKYCDEEAYDLALESYKKAEEAYPDFPLLHYNLGWLYGKLGKIDKAIEHLQNYIVLAPDAKDISEAQTYIVVLKQTKKKTEKLLSKFEKRDEIMRKALIEQKRKYDSVLIPAGEFLMGSKQGRENALPEHVVYLDAYEIDRYEITNAQYWEFLQYIRETNDHSKCFKGEPSGKDHIPKYWEKDYYNIPDYPVVRIDWYDAYAYAAWAGKRLPTEAEWEKAARGLDGRRFPWGNKWNPKRADLSGKPKPVGSNESGKSIFGCYDMAGSVYEWCSDWYNGSYYKESPKKNPKGPDNGLRKVIRGGSRFSRPFQLRSYARKSEQPNLFNIALGFRCVKDVEEESQGTH